MASTFPPPGAWLWTGLALVLAVAHARWLLPRLSTRLALLATALVVIGGAALALVWPGSALLSALPVTAVVFAHLGHAARPRAAPAPSRAPAPAFSTAATPAFSTAAAPALSASAPVPAAPEVPHAAAWPTPPATLPATPPATLHTTHPGAVPPVPGTGKLLPLLGRYRIDSEIGRGSMGAVYLGHDPQIGRQVALKTMALSREFQGDKLAEARSRFFREAETAGRLQHPDIVTIFDAGEAQDLAYIAMEYIQGADLQRHTAPDRLLPWTDVVALGARVADALAAAHRQGVVHRDVKPANVMVNLACGVVKVTDFGIARITDADRTRTGLVLGTPSYMSPEQMAGRRIDGRTDLYSLGVMLFQLLTGQLPHQGETMAKLMYQITNEAAPDLLTLRPELPQALADVVALALQKRAEVRYADGLQMAADLRAVMAQAPTPQSADFEKTVTLSRHDPRHNSAA